MASIEFAGFVFTDAGVAINGATVNLYDRNTTTPARATTTTNASGYYTISHATEGRFDIEIVNGSSIRRFKYDSAIQMQEIETANLLVRNPANTFKYDIVPAAITADRALNLPLITGTDTLAALALAQTFLTGVKTFNSSILAIRNPADTFSYTVVASAITAARNLTIPLLTGDDTLVVLAEAQTLTNKTLTSPVVNTQLTGTAVGTGASQVAVGNHTTPAMTATVAGHVPTPPNNTTTFLRGDGTFAAPSSSGLTRAGGNTTEATTTSTTAVDLLSATVTAIVAATPFMFGVNHRKTGGAAASIALGLKLNTTVVTEAVTTNSPTLVAVTSGVDQVELGAAQCFIGARVTSYLTSATGTYSTIDAGRFNVNNVVSTPVGKTADAPTADITTVVMRGISGNALVTAGADELQVYAYATS